jgi:HEPN domain-containing protein
MNVNDPRSWLLKADRDLNLARIAQIHAPDSPDLICYHCQQAGEKYLKALIIHYNIPLRKTHDLEELLDLLSSVEPSIEDAHYHEAIKLKIYAVGIRYPMSSGDPETSEVLAAFVSAEFFRSFAFGILGL